MEQKILLVELQLLLQLQLAANEQLKIELLHWLQLLHYWLHEYDDYLNLLADRQLSWP